MISTHCQGENTQVMLDELRSQHQGHEQRLEELQRKGHLTPEEEVEEKRLKKMKLRIRDQMEIIRRTAS